MRDSWLEQLRDIHAEALEIDWESHLLALNARHGFSGDHALSTPDIGTPPAWFNGDVEAIQVGTWVLVVSLNPAKPPSGYYRGELTAATAWDFWRRHNTEWWYTRFFRPLVRLAATALGERIPNPGSEERQFATERMVFVELCPYASRKYQIAPQTLDELGRTDVGFQVATSVRRILLDLAQPALVLVNGEDAVREFTDAEGEQLQWHRRDYLSMTARTKARQPKRLWHYEGWYQSTHGAIPVGGFKFLRKPANHNAYAEIDHLGQSLQRLVSLASGPVRSN